MRLAKTCGLNAPMRPRVPTHMLSALMKLNVRGQAFAWIRAQKSGRTYAATNAMALHFGDEHDMHGRQVDIKEHTMPQHP